MQFIYGKKCDSSDDRKKKSSAENRHCRQKICSMRSRWWCWPRIVTQFTVHTHPRLKHNGWHVFFLLLLPHSKLCNIYNVPKHEDDAMAGKTVDKCPSKCAIHKYHIFVYTLLFACINNLNRHFFHSVVWMSHKHTPDFLYIFLFLCSRNTRWAGCEMAVTKNQNGKKSRHSHSSSYMMYKWPVFITHKTILPNSPIGNAIAIARHDFSKTDLVAIKCVITVCNKKD